MGTRTIPVNLPSRVHCFMLVSPKFHLPTSKFRGEPGCGGPLFLTEAHDSGKGRIILPNSEKYEYTCRLFLFGVFFQSIFSQQFLLLRGKDFQQKKRSLLNRVLTWILIPRLASLSYSLLRKSLLGAEETAPSHPFVVWKIPCLFSLQSRSSIASTSSSRNVHQSIIILEYRNDALIERHVSLWPPSTVTFFFGKKKLCAFTVPTVPKKKTFYSETV